MSENKSNDFSNNYKLSVENMWSVTRGETGNWGIEGYEVPKEYFDHIKTKKGKEIWESIISTKPKSYWPPKLDKDDNDKPIWPKRPNFIEDVFSKNKFYFEVKVLNLFRLENGLIPTMTRKSQRESLKSLRARIRIGINRQKKSN